MARVAVIGEPERVAGFGLAGAVVCPATDDAAARSAWAGLDDEVTVVVLTAGAAAALAGLETEASTGRRLTVVMPP